MSNKEKDFMLRQAETKQNKMYEKAKRINAVNELDKFQKIDLINDTIDCLKYISDKLHEIDTRLSKIEGKKKNE